MVDRVLIPAGTFICGAGGGDDASSVAPCVVDVHAFHIDRHPVTVGAYAAFVEGGGYRRRAFWTRAGWAWRERERIVAPRFWAEAEWAPYLEPDRPVVGVSAHEAEAYASFVDARLPTELEWEKAARGTDGRRYPWGDAWLDGACGERGVGPRCTAAIGAYPAGVSPYGVLEMLGCVWQWCAGEPDDDERVTRGGAWNNLRWSISCTARNAFPLTARFSNLGFRCVSDEI
jgi:formylglycine-generating enzyme required for sulfatase activity